MTGHGQLALSFFLGITSEANDTNGLERDDLASSCRTETLFAGRMFCQPLLTKHGQCKNAGSGARHSNRFREVAGAHGQELDIRLVSAQEWMGGVANSRRYAV